MYFKLERSFVLFVLVWNDADDFAVQIQTKPSDAAAAGLSPMAVEEQMDQESSSQSVQSYQYSLCCQKQIDAMLMPVGHVPFK